MKPQPSKRITRNTLSRQQQIREEVYNILHEEAHKRYKSIIESEDNAYKRINALEQTGLPNHAMEEIKTAISQIRYKQHQQQRAMEGLLQFFNITKGFFDPEKWVKVSDGLPGRTGYYHCRIADGEECKLMHSWETKTFGLPVDGKWQTFDVLEWKDTSKTD